VAPHSGNREQGRRLRGAFVSDAGEGRRFTVEEARELLPQIQAVADELVDVRGRLTVGRHGDPPVPLADLKGLEARMADALDRIAAHGVQIKGWAPLLLDFPARYEDRDILLCWLEGEAALEWYHDVEHGFPGRRRLTELGW
jgi:hypothetical protein